MTNVGYHIRNGWLQKPPLGVPLNWAHPLTKGLVGCWLFNEGGGDKAYDLSGYGNHGTLKGMAFPPTTTSGWNPGKDGVGLTFDGGSDYVDARNDASLNATAAITLEVQIKTHSSATQRVFDKRGAGNQGFFLHISSVYVWFYTLTNTEVGTDSILIDGWHHIVATFDKTLSSKNIKIYIDSIKKGEGNGTNPLVITPNRLTIGSQNPDKWLDYYFNGDIYTARIYNRAISPSEVQQLYYTPYEMFEPATKYTIIDEALSTPFIGSNLAAIEMLR